MQSLSTGTASALAGSERGQTPFWSPDSRSIGFFSGGKLKTIEASGGSVQIVCEAPSPRGGTWSSKGVIVFAPDFRGGLSSVPASGGVPVPITKIDTRMHTTHRWPWFLPDGRHFLYLAVNHINPKWRTVGDLRSITRRRRTAPRSCPRTEAPRPCRDGSSRSARET